MKKILIFMLLSMLGFMFNNTAMATTANYFKKLNLQTLRCTSAGNFMLGQDIQLEIKVDNKTAVLSPNYTLNGGTKIALDQPIYFIDSVNIKIWNVKYLKGNNLLKELVITSSSPSNDVITFTGSKSFSYELSYNSGETSVKLGDNTLINLNSNLFTQADTSTQQYQTNATSNNTVNSNYNSYSNKDVVINDLNNRLMEKDNIINNLYQQLNQKDTLINSLYNKLNVKSTVTTKTTPVSKYSNYKNPYR